MYSWPSHYRNSFCFLVSISLSWPDRAPLKSRNLLADVTLVSQKMAARGFAARLWNRRVANTYG